MFPGPVRPKRVFGFPLSFTAFSRFLFTCALHFQDSDSGQIHAPQGNSSPSSLCLYPAHTGCRRGPLGSEPELPFLHCPVVDSFSHQPMLQLLLFPFKNFLDQILMVAFPSWISFQSRFLISKPSLKSSGKKKTWFVLLVIIILLLPLQIAAQFFFLSFFFFWSSCVVFTTFFPKQSANYVPSDSSHNAQISSSCLQIIGAMLGINTA